MKEFEIEVMVVERIGRPKDLEATGACEYMKVGLTSKMSFLY